MQLLCTVPQYSSHESGAPPSPPPAPDDDAEEELIAAELDACDALLADAPPAPHPGLVGSLAPGLVTMSFKRPGCSPVSSWSFAAPYTVCAARRRAVSRPRPTFTPPSARASIMSITYAGPLPERPVTASRSDSSSTTQRPTAS